MSKGRKQQPAAPAVDAGNEGTITLAQEASAERAQHLMVVDQQYGGLTEYHLGQTLSGIRFFMDQAGRSCLEAGRLLILVKEHEGHGGFLDALKSVNVHPRTAQRLMLVAAKFGKYDKLSHLPQSKLTELSVLNDDQLAELDKGGTVLGITFTEASLMSRQELEDALENALAENGSLQEIIGDKDKKINKLDRERRRVSELQAWSDKCAGLVDEIEACAKKIAPQMGALNQRLAELGEMVADEQPTDEEGKATAIRVMNAVHLLVNLLAPAQQRMYDEFQAYVPIEYTSTFTPKE